METKFAQMPHYMRARSGTGFWVDKRESCNEELKNLGQTVAKSSDSHRLTTYILYSSVKIKDISKKNASGCYSHDKGLELAFSSSSLNALSLSISIVMAHQANAHSGFLVRDIILED